MRLIHPVYYLLSVFLLACCGEGETQNPGENNPYSGSTKGDDYQRSTSTRVETRKTSKNPYVYQKNPSDMLSDESGRLSQEVREIEESAGFHLQLEGAVGLGTIEVDSGSQVSMKSGKGEVTLSSSQKVLVKISSEKEIEPVICSDAPGKVLQNISSVQPMEEAGFLVKGKFTGYDLLHIRKTGEALPIPDIKNPGKISYTADGKAWILASSALYRYDPLAGTLTRVSDEELSISDFTATSTGSVFITGKVRSTNARFTRYVKKDLGYTVLSDDTFGYGAFSFGKKAWFGDTMVYAEDEQLYFSYLPDSVKNFKHLGKDTNERLLSGRWLILDGPEDSFSSFDLMKGGMAGNPFHENSYPYYRSTGIKGMIDYQKGLAFDGFNVVKIINNQNQPEAVTEKILIFPGSQNFRMKHMYGPAQGFPDWRGIIIHKETEHSYWVSVDPETGMVDLENRRAVISENKPLISQHTPLIFYHLGEKNLAYMRVSGHHRAYLVREEDDGIMELLSITNLGADLSYAVVKEQNLFFRNSDHSIGHYDSNAGTMVTYQPFGDTGYCRRLHGLLPMPSGGGLRAILSTTSHCGNAANTLIIRDFPDFKTSAFSSQNYPLRGVNPHSFHFFSNSQEQLLINAFDSSNSAKGILFTVLESTEEMSEGIPYYKIKRSGINDLNLPGHQSLEIIRPFGTAQLIAGIKTDNQYSAYRVDVASALTHGIPELSGVQIYSFSSLSSEFFSLSGLRVSENQKIQVLFDQTGHLISEFSTPGYSLQEYYPLGKNIREEPH